MVIIKKEKPKIFIKEKLELNKNTLKVISIFSITFFVLFEVFIYARRYYINNNLCFTHEDKFLFTIFIFSVVFVCCLLLYLLIKQKTLTDLLKKVYHAITESENNIINLEKTTQEMILKLFNKDKN